MIVNVAAQRLDRGPSRAAWLATPPSPLYRLKIREGWRFLRRQPASFWFVCVYIFLEYVRPQAIYGPIQGMPLASIAIFLCGLALVLESKRLHPLRSVDWLLVLFGVVILLSSITAYYPSWSQDRYMSYFGWVVAYILITMSVDNDRRFLLFMLLYFLWNLKMSQHGTRGFVGRGFSFASYGLTCAPQFFQNSGECGIQMAMFFPSSLYFLLGLKAFVSRKTKWILAVLPVTAALTIVGSSSRGAQLALGVILLWMVTRSRHPLRAIVGVVVSAAMLYAVLPEEQKERFRTMGDDETSQSRITYWEDGIEIMNEHPVLGVGFKNWLPYYHERYNPQGHLPHNVFVEAGAELGYTGLLVFIALIAATFVMNYRTRKIAQRLRTGSFFWHMAHGLDGALLGFLIGGFFVTVLYYPFFWMNLAMTVALYNVTAKAARDEQRLLQRARAANPNQLQTRVGTTRPDASPA